MGGVLVQWLKKKECSLCGGKVCREKQAAQGQKVLSLERPKVESSDLH